MAAPAHLPHSAVTKTVNRLSEEIGKKDHQRLLNLIPLINEQRQVPLADALATLYPEQDTPAALTSFRLFRSRIKHAADEANLDFELVVDSHKKSPPQQRRCWFEGESHTQVELQRLADEETAPTAKSIGIPTRAIELKETTEDGRPIIRYFISYAHADKKLTQDLRQRLQDCLNLAIDFHFEAWDDGEILPGERWFSEIETAIQRCDFGLLLVSYKFLGSKFISEHELPHFISEDPSNPVAWKRAIPVGLRKIAFDGKKKSQRTGTTPTLS